MTAAKINPVSSTKNCGEVWRLEMTKPVKTTVTFALVASLASAGFSQTAAKSSENPMRNGERRHFDFRNPHGNPGFGKTIENVLIGTVKKVSLSTNEITVVNSDGKDVVVKVSPFTKIDVEITDKNFKKIEPKAPEARPEDAQKPSNNQLPPPSSPKSHELSEIKYGSWVLVSLFKSETKSQNAASVFAKVRETSLVDTANAK